jgi:hypothetical protein
MHKPYLLKNQQVDEMETDSGGDTRSTSLAKRSVEIW